MSDQFTPFQPQEQLTSDSAYFDDIPERDWPTNVPNPDGWDKPWPFAAEVALWMIPWEDRERALHHEEERERVRLHNERNDANEPVLKPWLALTGAGQGWVATQHYKSFDYPTSQQNKAVYLLTAKEFKVMLKQLPSAIHRSVARWLNGWNQTGLLPPDTLDPVTDPRNVCMVEKAMPDEVRDIRSLSVGIAKWATKKDAEEGFRALIDELEAKDMIQFEKPKHGRQSVNVDTYLASLSLTRLHLSDPYSEFWKPLAGTDLETWTEPAFEWGTERNVTQSIRKQCQRKIRESIARLYKQ